MAYPFNVPIDTPISIPPTSPLTNLRTSKLAGLSSSTSTLETKKPSPRPRTNSLSPKQPTYYYRASVFQTDDRYELHMAVDTVNYPDIPTPANKGVLVFEYTYNTWKSVKLYQLSYMFMRKFQPKLSPYQQTDGEVTVYIQPIMSRAECLFTCIQADLDFIKNIIMTEIDFHVGKRICMRDENKVALERYTSDMDTKFDYKREP